MMLRVIAITIAVLIGAKALGSSPARLVGESRRTLERLDEITSAHQSGHAERTLELCLRLMDQSGQDWVPLPGERRWVTVRSYLDEKIRSDDKLAEAYRFRFEQRAADLLKRAQSTRNATLLKQVVDDYWPTKSATSALDLLGDASFESGDFPMARHWWREAARRHSVDSMATLQAKLILATAGCREPIVEMRHIWERDFPDAVGSLAGRKGSLKDILAETLKSFAPALIEDQQPNWPDDRRGRWHMIRERVALPGRLAISTTSPTQVFQRPNLTHRQHWLRPALWRDLAVVADGPRVTAYHLATGNIADSFSLINNDDIHEIPPTPPVTMAGDCILARLTGKKNEAGGMICCLDQEPNTEGFRWRVRWQLPTSALATTGIIAFEGTPIVRNNDMYLSWTQTIGSRITVWLSAYSLDRVGDGPRWSKPIVELGLESSRARPHQVILAGPHVLYATDNGLIAAFAAETGQSVWAASYEPTTIKNRVLRSMYEHQVSGGRLFLAPADAEFVTAYDVWTGRTIWPSPIPLRVAHLLGIVDGQLIATADGQFRGLTMINGVNGRVDFNWGSLAGPDPYGRGLVLADRILFPTRQVGVAIIGRHGEPIYAPTILQNLGGGNLAMKGNYMVVAQGDELNFLKFSAIGGRPAGLDSSIP